MPSAADIVRFADAPAPPGQTPWVAGAEPLPDIVIAEPNAAWAEAFAVLEGRIRGALGPTAVSVTHVGSTSVAGLPAKPIIDIDLIVADPDDEDAYVPALEAAGFRLRVREPWWYGHRCFGATEPLCNLHVFPPDCPEAARHLIFRDWLRTHPEDRERYADAKRAAAAAANERGEHVMQYNARKQDVVREIYDRAFRGLGLLPEV
ncbi:GrpB family protein [Microbacterium sp. AZCO]|uniref:GrpB family protein n=1 Tax=Microbacterium sp. AZCO TaxID=3142976 RepID=UPI0031F3FEBA